MYAESFDNEDLNLNLYYASSDEDGSDLDGSGDPLLRNLGELQQDIYGVYCPTDELDDDEEEQACPPRLPPLPPFPGGPCPPQYFGAARVIML
jgi:hypothetical protein